MSYIENDDKLNEIVGDFDKFLMEYEQEDSKPIFEDVSENIKILMLIYVCGICHNMNWDYLCNNFMYKLKLYSQDFNTDFLVDIDESVIERFFEEYPKKYKVEATRRTGMIRSIAKDLYVNTDIVDKIKNVTKLKGQDGLFEIINRNIEVFNEDPLHKKTNLLAQLLINDKMIKVADEYNIEPLVDYHIMRLYLRTGRIKIVSQDLVNKIMEKEQLHLAQITELRIMIADQIKRFCVKYNKTADELNKIDWYIGRNICEQKRARCKECPYNKYCDSSNKKLEEMLIEPIDNHGFY